VLSRRHSVQKRGRYGKPADQWSLGVILYVLLSGTPPFEVSHFGNMLDGETFDVEFPPEHWTGISDQAKDLVRKLLVADPQERLTVEQAMQHDWINTEDGDTHVFPLDDPKLQFLVASTSTLTNQHNVQQQQPQQVFQKRLFTAVTGKTTLAAAAAASAVAASSSQQQQDVAENNDLLKNRVDEKQQHPQKRSAVSVAESTQISPEPALAAKKKRCDLEPSSFGCSEEEPSTHKNRNEEQVEDAHDDPPLPETTTSTTTTLPPRVSDVAPPLCTRQHNNTDSAPRRPLSPTSFNANRHDEIMMKTEIKSKHDEKILASSSLPSSANAASDDAPFTLHFGSNAFGAVHAKSQEERFFEESNNMKAAAMTAPLASLANQPVLEKDDILSDFSENTESIGSFGGAGDSMGAFASRKEAAADLVVTKPEARRLKKRKEPQQQSNGEGGGNGTTATTSSAAAPKRRRVSALMSDSLASLGPVTTATTTKKIKGNTGKQRATRKTKGQKSQKTKQQQLHGHQTTLSGWVKK
jgi:serine/threonine protein kinase